MEVKEVKISFSDEEMESIKDIAEVIHKKLGSPDNQILNKNFIFNIFFALLSASAIGSIFEFYYEFEDEEKDKILMNLYDDLINLKKDGFASKDLIKRTETRYNYYEKAIKLRSKIQATEWKYHNLHKDTAQFIQGRELAKLLYSKTSLMNKKEKYIPCPVCNTKWLKSETENCLRCDKENDISMFIKLCTTFEIIADMDTFYECLEKNTSETLYNNWNYILSYLEKYRIDRKGSLLAYRREKYGREQFSKIVKYDRGSWRIDEDFFNFNKKYNTAFLQGTLELKFENAHNMNTEEFMKDLNKLHFTLCTKIIFSNKKIILNLFKPNMLLLKTIKADNCGLHNLDLDPQYFPELNELVIDNNEIQSYEDIKNLNKLSKLGIISIYGNPIENTLDIYRLEKEFFKINIRYSYRRKFISKDRIKFEEDPDVKEIMEKNIDFNESDNENIK